MSTNAWLSEQVIHFYGTSETRFGFYVSGASYSEECFPFESPKQRQAFIEAITAALPEEWKDDAFTVAALACLNAYTEEGRGEANYWSLAYYLNRDESEAGNPDEADESDLLETVTEAVTAFQQKAWGAA